MQRPTLEQIKSVCESCDQIQWYGAYQGRWGFNGYAVVADNASALAELIMELNRRGLEFVPFNHEDNMGLSRLFAWSEDVFFTPKSKTNYKFRKLNEAG